MKSSVRLLIFCQCVYKTASFIVGIKGHAEFGSLEDSIWFDEHRSVIIRVSYLM